MAKNHFLFLYIFIVFTCRKRA